MLRAYVKARPYLIAASLLFLATFNTSNALRVPMSQVPREIYDRYLSRVKPDDDPARLLKEADEGNALAAYYYALRHTGYCPRDLRIAVNRERAFEYMKKSVDGAARPRAEAVLALYYLNGWGTNADLNEARRLAERAKEYGQVLGYRVLGELHLKQAEELLAAKGAGGTAGKPADAGQPDALEAEVKAALSDLGYAAERGNAGALKALARIHDQGDLGRPRDHRLATDCYKQAALRRDEKAARILAERHEQGEKTERDLRLAYAWTLVELQLTEEKTEVAKRRDTLEAKLTVTDKLGAQEQAKQWLALMPSEEDSARARLDPDR